MKLSEEIFASVTADFATDLHRLESYIGRYGLAVFSECLYRYLQMHHSVRLDGWFICLDDGCIWLTSPYGLDVGCCDDTDKVCELICERIVHDKSIDYWR